MFKTNYVITQQLKSNDMITKYRMKAISKRAIKKYYQSGSKKRALLLNIEKTKKQCYIVLNKRIFKEFEAVHI